MFPVREKQFCNSIASSIASFVPEPIEKCAVCKASPSKTTFSKDHRPFFTNTKLIHFELFESNRQPSRSFAKKAPRNSRVCSSVISTNPAFSHVRGSHSTINVLVALLNVILGRGRKPDLLI